MNFVTVLFFLGLLLTIVASVGLLRLTGKKAPQEQRLWPLAQKPAADEMAETEKDTENAEDAAPEQAAPKAPAAGKKRLSVPNLIVLGSLCHAGGAGTGRPVRHRRLWSI